MSASVLICGIGGQGTVLAAKLLAQAALLAGLKVRSAETIGMAQRGGSVTSHVRIGDGCHSPLIPLGHADMIIAFELAEAVRNLPYLRTGGTVIVNDKLINPVNALLAGKAFSSEVMFEYLRRNAGKVTVVDTVEACRELGSDKVVNTVLIGTAAANGIAGINIENLRQAVTFSVKPQFQKLNLRAIDKGFDSNNDWRKS